ncbi:MAG: TIGR03960 family B12-binding radical SAM protein [Firmicutes bacterium]|nr:TIGR03960 family B12-binding radical SAM protein [Bacillota bacterium]
MKSKYEEILLNVRKPARYIGGEYNLPDFSVPKKVSFCLCFPDLYEVGMSNLGLQILYSILNGVKEVSCERCFAPWKDYAQQLRENNLPLASLETVKPLKDFDCLGFSIQYELGYTSLLYMLDLAGIPFRAKDRGNEFPLLIAGGPCTANPEPYADFFDLILIGDGEEFIEAFAEIVKKHKGDKLKILKEAVKLNGAYVPSLAKTENGITVTPVKKAVVKDLNLSKYPLKPLVANTEIVHDRPVVELFRGCYAGCRFCQACFFYRPIRLRNEETVVKTAEALIKSTGAEEIGFSSLSSGDYPYISGAINKVFKLASAKNVKLQLPSLRLDSYLECFSDNHRKSGLTFAPEAGTQRLRNVINKNITDSDIENTFSQAFTKGYKSVKLYFMIGLPTETDEDIEGIAKTVRNIKDIFFKTTGGKALSINVSVAVFVPKPITPFQWEEQISIAEMKRRRQLLGGLLRQIRGVHFGWHEESESFLEAVFARGGRELSYLVEKAYALGSYLDSWTELYNFSVWEKAIGELNINTSLYTARKDINARLPWDYIDFSVAKEYLKNEYEKSLKGETTKSCKGGCLLCGAEC